MDERESDTASSVDFYETDPKLSTPPKESHDDAPVAKRKAEELAHTQEKKRKLDSFSEPPCALESCAGLPPAVWQHVFLSCSLSDLGRLLQVNRSFHSYLTGIRNAPLQGPESGALRLLKSESVWASARNALPVKPPKPLPGFSEMRMWRLAWAKRCQFCQKESSFIAGEKIWQKGPSSSGVRTIWPFGIKACGPCLMERCQTDASLLFSNASALRPALPFAFITSEQNYIPAYTLQAATTPASVEIAKYYYREHVEDITKALNDALGLGAAAAEEWSKGLEARGNERMKTAENWERWEVKFQWWSEHNEPKHVTPPPSSPPAPTQREPTPSKSPAHQAPSPVIHAPVPAGKYSSASGAARDGSMLPRLNHTPPVPGLTASATIPRYMQPRPPTVPLQYTPHPLPTGSVQPRSERNLHDANEAKANRKANIERRCQQMDPPIPPNVLRHMESFKAAIQIPQPMTDYAWSQLQPRLLAQLPAAQQAEADHVSRVAALPKATERRHPDINSKEAKEVMDREWEESQRTTRDKLNAIADDFIDQDWDHGRAVTYDNSPKFAVDLLIYVRRKFYEDLDTTHKPSGQEHRETVTEDGSDLSRPGLVLENMKWVYDNKIKPLTEQYRKELFLCHGTGCEGQIRFYGFEGVIQHFGAKHTSAFSVGNVVVAWREAEWPEETPFHPDPISVKHAYHAAQSTAGHAGYGAFYSGYSRAGTSTPHVQPHLPQASPGPYHFGGHFNNGPFAPPQVQGYEMGQAYGAQAESYPYQPMVPPAYGSQAGNGFMSSPAVSNPAMVPLPGLSQAPGMNESLPRSGAVGHGSNSFDKQVSTVIEMAQDVWKQTSGIKDLPNSLRIYVLLQRVISKFHVEFNHEPTLNHFIDALSNSEIPYALRNAAGLSCKACQEELSHYPTRQEERKTYAVLNLFSHFKSQHAGHSGAPVSGFGTGQPASTPDWKEDMIELPSDRFISGLIHAQGMDDDKLHMIATVFPRLFPTPLPKIGVVDHNGMASPPQPVPKDSKDTHRAGGTPGVTTEKSDPSSSGSGRAESPQDAKHMDDEYDPQRPALPAQTNQSSRAANRVHPFRGSPPPADRRTRYYSPPRFYLAREPMDNEYSRPREYLEYAPSPRKIRDPGPLYEGYHERRPLFRDHEAFYHPGHDEVVYTQPRDGVQIEDYRPVSRQVRYLEEESRRPEFRYVREPRSREASPLGDRAAAERFLEEFVPGRPSTNEPTEQPSAPPAEQNPLAPEADVDDGSRYTPPPPNVPSTDEAQGQISSIGPPHTTAPSTVSNGSRHDEYRPGVRHVPTPDPSRGPRRPGPFRRRDRYHDHYVPSRYYRYMNVARDEPYSRGASMSRSQSKRYERYEEQRRRIDQQETPQPMEMAYSREVSVDQGHPDDVPPQVRQAPREYVSIQDRLHPYSPPPRYRYAGYPEEPRGPPEVFVDQYGRQVHEYEIIRVPREPRPARGSYIPHRSPNSYVGHEPEHIQYVPVAYDRPLPQRYEGRPDYVYYEERERPPPARRPAYEPAESTYEPPPEIKVESEAAPMPGGP